MSRLKSAMVLYFLFVLTYRKDCFDLPGLINASHVSLTQSYENWKFLRSAVQCFTKHSFHLFFPSVVMLGTIFVTEAIVKSK